MEKRFPSGLRSVFSAVALTGSLLGAQACASVGATPHPPAPSEETADRFRLLMSEKTESGLGSMASLLKRAVPLWAQSDILLLTPGDTEGLAAMPEHYPTSEQIDSAAASMKTIFSRHREFFDTPRYLNETDSKKLAYMYWSIQAGQAGALDLWDGDRKAAIIIMPDFREESLSLFNQLPDSIFSRQPDIGFEEFVINVLMHEAGHIKLGHMLYTNETRPGQDLRSLEQETAADRFLLSGYDEIESSGLPYNKSLPFFVEDLRAISALRIMGGITQDRWSEFYTHGTHITLSVEKEEDGNGVRIVEDNRFDTARQAAGMVRVNDMAIAALASVTRSRINPDSASPYPFGIDPNILMGIGNDYQAGTAIARHYMFLQYGAVRTLMDRGYFHADSVEAVIAGEYLDAFERLAPGVGTDPGLLAFLAAAAEMPDLFAHTSLKPEVINEGYDEDYLAMKAALDALRAGPPAPAPAPVPLMF